MLNTAVEETLDQTIISGGGSWTEDREKDKEGIALFLVRSNTDTT
jgi:hypothetical protein